MYHRPTIDRMGTVSPFESHLKLSAHSQTRRFTDNYWVSENFLTGKLCQKLHLLKDAMGISLSESRTKRECVHYNINETNNPTEIKKRLKRVACSIFTGRRYPPIVQEGLLEASLKFDTNWTLWFQKSQLNRLHQHSIEVLPSANGVDIENPKFGLQRYYNFSETSDPLKLYKAGVQEWSKVVRFCDFASRRKFRQVECCLLAAHQTENNFVGYTYIKAMDLLRFQARVKHVHKEKYVRVGGSKWYNLDQLSNKGDVMQRELKERNRL